MILFEVYTRTHSLFERENDILNYLHGFFVAEYFVLYFTWLCGLMCVCVCLFEHDIYAIFFKL